MKRFFDFLAVLLLFGAVAASAAGDPEANAQLGPRGQRGFRTYDDCCVEDWDAETISITGTVELKTDDHPELVTSDGTYELMYPYYLSEGIEVENGDIITVEGILMPGLRFEDGDENHLRVTKAIIGDKEYDLADVANGGRWALMGGGMHGRAPGRGYSHGRRIAPQGRLQQQGRR